MTDPLAGWWVHEVGIRRLIGSGAGGDVFTPAPPAAPEPARGFVRDGATLVVGPDGQTVTSSAQVALPIAVDGVPVARVPVGSKVTLPAVFGGRTSTVIASAVGDGGGQPTPDHHELALK